MAIIKFTRETIYELVWSKPFITIAKEYDISDNGIRKICRKYNIPYPKAGHWQKIKYGYKVKKIPLPKNSEFSETTINFSERDENEINKHQQLKLLIGEIEKDNIDFLTVSEKLSKPDTLVLAAKKDLISKKAPKIDGYNSFVNSSVGILNIRVSKENIQRALCFMDTLIKLIKKNGHKIEINGYETNFIINGIKFNVHFSEIQKRIKIEHSEWRILDRYILVPCGEFSFCFGDYFGKSWKDGKVLIENRISEIYSTMLIKSQEKKEYIERQKIEQEERERKRIIELKIRAEKEKDKKKMDLFIKDANTFQQSINLKLLIMELEKLYENDRDNSELKSWLDWANIKQKKIDPLGKGVNSFLSKYNIEIDINRLSYY